MMELFPEVRPLTCDCSVPYSQNRAVSGVGRHLWTHLAFPTSGDRTRAGVAPGFLGSPADMPSPASTEQTAATAAAAEDAMRPGSKVLEDDVPIAKLRKRVPLSHLAESPM